MHRAYLSLGTNLGNKRANLDTAVMHIKAEIGEITLLSSPFATLPWGFESANTFLNIALCVLTPLEPPQLLSATQSIETHMGRTSKTADGRYHDRVIDIDILIIDDLIIDTPSLTVPHPLMTQRTFVIDPLCQIAPGLVHPVTGETIAGIHRRLHSSGKPGR